MTENKDALEVENMKERLRRIASLANAACTFRDVAMMRNVELINDEIAKLNATPPAQDAMREALEWALAEINGLTRYENEQQRENCIALAESTLSTPQPESVEANVQLVSLADCPPGPFEFNGGLGFKTEYGAMRPVANHALPCFSVSRFPDAYCMESGEFFWGGTTTHEERAKLLVRPIDVAEVAQHGEGR